MFYKVKNYRKGGERDLAEYRNNYRQRENKSVYGERNTYEKRKITEMEITDNRT